MKYGGVMVVVGGLLASLGVFTFLRLLESLVKAEIYAHQLDQRFGFRCGGSSPAGPSLAHQERAT